MAHGYSPDSVTNKLIGIVVFIAVFVGLAPTVLTYFTNLSTSGIVLAGVIATISGILFGVFALKGIMHMLK